MGGHFFWGGGESMSKVVLLWKYEHFWWWSFGGEELISLPTKTQENFNTAFLSKRVKNHKGLGTSKGGNTLYSSFLAGSKKCDAMMTGGVSTHPLWSKHLSARVPGLHNYIFMIRVFRQHLLGKTTFYETKTLNARQSNLEIWFPSRMEMHQQQREI